MKLHFFKYRFSRLKPCLIGLFFVFFLLGTPWQSLKAQENKKTRYEKIQEKKNKANRRLKRRGDKAKKKRNSFTKFKIRSRQGDRAYKGDIVGKKVRSRISPSRRSRAVHPQPNPYAGRKFKSEAARAKAFNKTVRYSSKPREKAWKGSLSGNAIRTKGFRSEKKRLKPQTSPYYRRGAQSRERDGAKMSGQGFKGIRSISGRSRGGKDKRIVPRSASGAYRVRKREKPYAIRERSKWESAYQGDITGRKFQTKRTTDRPGIKPRPNVKYSGQGKGRRGDRAYKGRITGGYQSATSGKERAWKGDISGTKLRKRTSSEPKFNGIQFKPYYQRKRRGDKAYKGKLKGSGYKTLGRNAEKTQKALPGKPPAAGSEKAILFQGNIKARKPLKGGGSISGKRWNNSGRPIDGRGIQSQDQKTAGFQGNIKARRPQKGGGSISGGNWNNRGRAIDGRSPTAQDQKSARFQGNLKGDKRRLKGGGSISGDRWNNKGEPLQKKPISPQIYWATQFKGRFKRGKKDGATEQDKKTARHTGNLRQWKYNTGPLAEMKYEGRIKQSQKYVKNPNSAKEALKSKYLKGADKNAANFTGNIKQWKYNTGPLAEMKYEGRYKRRNKPVRNPNSAKEALKKYYKSGSDKEAANFTGNIRKWKYNTGPLDEMKYEGRYKRQGKYKRNPNSAKESLLSKIPEKQAAKGFDYQGNLKISRSAYKKKPNASEEALKGIGPKKGSIEGSKYQGTLKVSRFAYKKKPNASEEALKGIGPEKGSIQASKFQGRSKVSRFAYKKKPNASDEAMKGIGPSRAAISASNFQGNLKMKKGRTGDKHPSYKFESPKDTPIDKTKFSLKLLWSKLFKKNENQPGNLKEKPRKPRYDKGEEGLWND